MIDLLIGKEVVIWSYPKTIERFECGFIYHAKLETVEISHSNPFLDPAPSYLSTTKRQMRMWGLESTNHIKVVPN